MVTAYDEKFAFLYGVDKSETELLRGLAAAGVEAADINKVILTHLHFDHAGGNCFQVEDSRNGEEDGEFKPTFPNAVYYINQGELAYAKEPDPRSKPSYLPHTWEPLERQGQVALISGDKEVAPGVTVLSCTGPYTQPSDR